MYAILIIRCEAAARRPVERRQLRDVVRKRGPVRGNCRIERETPAVPPPSPLSWPYGDVVFPSHPPSWARLKISAELPMDCWIERNHEKHRFGHVLPR